MTTKENVSEEKLRLVHKKILIASLVIIGIITFHIFNALWEEIPPTCTPISPGGDAFVCHK